MRFLKGIFYLGLLIIGLFFLSGLVFPQITYTVSQQVNVPVDQAFILFNDNKTMKNWMPALKELTLIEEKPGLVGSRYRIKVEAQGEIMEMEETVVAFKQNEKVSLEIRSVDMLKNDEYTFKGSGNQTIIQNKSSIQGTTYFLRCLYASFYLLIKAEDQATLDSFKAFAEQ